MNKKTQIFMASLFTLCFAPLLAKLFVTRILEPTEASSVLNAVVLVAFCAVIFGISLFIISFREYLNRDKEIEEPKK